MPIDVQFPGNLGQVDTIAKLRAVPTSAIDIETVYIAMDVGRTYSFDFGSLLNDDGINVIRPNDRTPLQAGRFIYLVDGFAPGNPGAPGPAGPADNTYATLAALLASDPSRRSARLVPQAGETAAPGNFNYVGGAWVRQVSEGITARRDAIAAMARTAQAEFNDAVKITQFGAVGGDKAKDTAGFNAAVAYAWTRNRAVCIPDSDVPFIFDKIVLPINEQGIDGDSARPTKFTICGTGTVQFTENGFLFDTTADRYFYDLTIAGTLRFISTEDSGGKFINGDAFIRLNLTPGLQINKFDWGIFATDYLQSIRVLGVTQRGGKGAFIKAPMAYDCSITDNIVEFGTDGVVIDADADPAVHTCRIDGNVIEGMAGRGIVVGPCLATSIDGNYMEGNAGGEVFFTGTAAHKGLRFQCNSFQQTGARIASGAYSAVWSASLALPVMAGGNFCTGHLHDLAGTSGLLFTFGDYVPAGKNLTRPDVGRSIATDDFTFVSQWFDRSIWMDPYQQEVVFKGKFGTATVPPVVCFGTNSPSNTPAAFERKDWAQGSVVYNVGAAAAGDVSHWVCVAAGTPGSWRPGGVLPA